MCKVTLNSKSLWIMFNFHETAQLSSAQNRDAFNSSTTIIGKIMESGKKGSCVFGISID